MRLVQISRGQNRHANSLATLASSLTNEVSQLIKVEVVKEPSINPKVNVLAIIVSKPCWMDPIVEFLAENHLLSESKEADKVGRISTRFWLLEDHRLYRRSFGGPYLLCLLPTKVNELLAKLHEEVYGSHVGGRSLAHRAMTHGFWWPKIQRDVADYVKKVQTMSKARPIDTLACRKPESQ